ncbi:MAG: hypothetical protein M9894_09015 [Planctomycetes bacterium]|nr:hypothetical protein [Planctomycetota bacterium]
MAGTAGAGGWTCPVCGAAGEAACPGCAHDLPARGADRFWTPVGAATVGLVPATALLVWQGAAPGWAALAAYALAWGWCAHRPDELAAAPARRLHARLKPLLFRWFCFVLLIGVAVPVAGYPVPGVIVWVAAGFAFPLLQVAVQGLGDHDPRGAHSRAGEDEPAQEDSGGGGRPTERS